MKLWMRLTLCAWLSACGSGPAPSGTSPGPTPGPVPPPTSVRLPAFSPVGVPTPCVRPAYGRGSEHALLRVGCEDRLEPGRATWTVTGDTVVLEFPPESRGPRGVELVNTWPPLDRPPWLGHGVNRVAVLGDGGIRVEFGEPSRDPARVFVDPRLSGVPLPVAVGDGRDAIDADTGEIVTRHDASIEYARSLGRSVEPVAFDIKLSFKILFMVIVGGLGTINGAFIGAAFILLFPVVLNSIGNKVFHGAIDATIISSIEQVVFGVLIIVFMIYEPLGMAKLWESMKQRLWQMMSLKSGLSRQRET